MTGQVIAPVIPSSMNKPGSVGPVGSRVVRALPLAVPSMHVAAPTDVVYGMGRLDASGRVADRVVIQALGWQPGDRLTLTGTPGVILARRDPAGMVTLGHKPYVTLPAALRNRCGLRAGDRVLLAATLDEDLLAVYPPIAVHQAIRSSLPVEGGESQ